MTLHYYATAAFSGSFPAAFWVAATYCVHDDRHIDWDILWEVRLWHG